MLKVLDFIHTPEVEIGDLVDRLARTVWGRDHSPRVNYYNEDERIRLDVLLPGYDPKDISLEYENGHLVLEAVRQKEEGKYLIEEIPEGKIIRVLPLPTEIQPETIKAKYENGILHITAEKEEQCKTKRIAIQ